jgi:hypothetical protein
VDVRRMIEMWVKEGEGRTAVLSGRERKTYNQRITGTISERTLRWLLKRAAEQLCECHDCRDVSLF